MVGGRWYELQCTHATTTGRYRKEAQGTVAPEHRHSWKAWRICTIALAWLHMDTWHCFAHVREQTPPNNAVQWCVDRSEV